MSAKQTAVIIIILLLAIAVGLVIATGWTSAAPAYANPIECVVIAARDAVFCR